MRLRASHQVFSDDGLDRKGTGEVIRLDREKQPVHLMS